jgi:RHS repeat-associated protein
VDVYGATAPAKQSTYSYDQAGNVLSIADTANSASSDVQCFAYDSRQRLSEAWTPASTTTNAAGSGTIGSTSPVDGSGPNACKAAPGTSALGGPAPYWKSYTTDAIGNRESETNHDTGLNAAKDITRRYEYGGAGALGDGPHQLTKVVEKTPTGEKQYAYEYNDAGATTKRTISGDAQTLDWDDSGRLTKVKEASGSETTYLYDAMGSRIQRKDSSGTTVYLPGMELKLSADGTKKSATRYYSYAGETVAVRTDDGKLSFLAADHHGTGEIAVGDTGAVSQRRFDPYGVTRGNATGTWPGEKGYVGGTIDSSTGLTHLGAREYDAVIGKFISVDPIIDYTQPQQINGYTYANNSPVTLSDPSGLKASPTCSLFPSAIGCGVPDCGILCAPGSDSAKVSEAKKEVSQAQSQQSSAKKRISSAGKQLVKIVRDILGVDAALDCISTGDIGACGETLLNIAGSFAGGLAGKIMAKYGMPWNWAKGAKLAKRVVGLVGELIDGVKDYFKATKTLAKAKDGLAAARAKAAAALNKLRKSECHSFLPGTKVLLADGSTKPIEDVELGDKVTVTDPKTGQTTVREIAGTIVTEDDKEFSDLTVKTASGEAQALVATTTHPFWVVSERAWIKAGDLKPGMKLRTPSGDTVEVTTNHHFVKRQRTHDLTVSDVHTYYVLAGATPVLVHNCGEAAEAASEGPQSLYHYTNEAGHDGIISSGEMRPSLKANNPKDARYGDGQYLTDIKPGTKTLGQLSAAFLRVPWAGRKFTHYIEIDVRGLDVVEGRPGVFVIPNSGPLDLTGRILSSGRN